MTCQLGTGWTDKCIEPAKESSVGGVGYKAAACDGSSFQLWSQGFGSASAREIRNLRTGLSMTLEPKLGQRLDIGLKSQKWEIRSV